MSDTKLKGKMISLPFSAVFQHLDRFEFFFFVQCNYRDFSFALSARCEVHTYWGCPLKQETFRPSIFIALKYESMAVGGQGLNDQVGEFWIIELGFMVSDFDRRSFQLHS